MNKIMDTGFILYLKRMSLGHKDSPNLTHTYIPHCYIVVSIVFSIIPRPPKNPNIYPIII